MEKENLSTLALIGFLLLLVIVALYINKEQELVATRSNYNEVISNVFSNFGEPTGSSEAELSGACPTGCITDEAAVTAQNNQKDVWRRDPASYISSVIEKEFATQLDNHDLEQANFVNDQLWWRSQEENYRLLIPNATVVGFQVPTTERAGELTPKDDDTAHPASTHPLFKKIIKQINRSMSSLGFKKGQFAQCPISEAYDPFNNCLQTYTYEDMKCSLIGGYGRLDRQASEQPYLRLELSCSNQYDAAYAQQAPYLYALRMINPEWRVPDMAVYSVTTLGEWSRVDFGTNFGIFQKIDNGYRLITGGLTQPTCGLVREKNIPQAIYQTCR